MNELVAPATYLLCAFTAFSCAFLLLRGYFRTGVRLLLWSGICFIAFTVENGLLFINLVIIPDVDLAMLRRSSALLGLLFLLYGLIWDVKSP